MKYATAVVLACGLLFSSASVEVKAQSWSTFTESDEMTGEVQAYAHSPNTTATESLSFPYRGVEAWLGFGCDGQSEWAYVGFSKSPNLTNTEPQSGGYSTFKTRIRWDDRIKDVYMSQEWGDKFLQFQSDAVAIENMMNARTALFELSWYGSGTVYFRFTLNGSAQAIRSARQRCRG